jgi:hypothetical protein
VYLLPHYGSHPAPWAQQAFTCCADLNGGSALFFGWSEPYSRHPSIYTFVKEFLKNILLSLDNKPGLMQESRNLTHKSMKKLRNMMLLDQDWMKILMLQLI